MQKSASLASARLEDKIKEALTSEAESALLLLLLAAAAAAALPLLTLI